MKKEALDFMVKNRLDKCFECEGRIFKHKHNAETMSGSKSNAPIQEHDRETLAKELAGSKTE